MPPDPLICDDVVQIYPSTGGNVAALRGISVRFPSATVTAIVGGSGAGKSTLLRLLAGMEAPSAGDVIVAGMRTAALSDRRRRRLFPASTGYVFQVPRDNLIENVSIADHIKLVSALRGLSTREAAVRSALDDTEFAELSKSKASELSPGQQQKFAFMLACLGRPHVVIADEPSAQLDSAERAQLATLLRRLSGSGMTLVIATHDHAMMSVATHVLTLERGSAVALSQAR